MEARWDRAGRRLAAEIWAPATGLFELTQPRYADRVADQLASWESINDGSYTSLLLGNGASINTWQRFAYSGLYEIASDRGHLVPVDDLFRALNTTDFEFVMTRLAESRTVLSATRRPVEWIEDLYDSVKSALFNAVRDVHVPWRRLNDSHSTWKAWGSAIAKFRTVYTTNYDLVLYWSALLASSYTRSLIRPKVPEIVTSDLMARRGSDLIYVPERAIPTGATTICYLHGALHLWQDVKTGRVGKRSSQSDQGGMSILDQLREVTKVDDSRQPLFVCEGTSLSKMRTIRSSRYLTDMYLRLQNSTESIVVFGSSLGASDSHIAAAIASNLNPVSAVAVAILPADDADAAIERIGRSLALPQKKIRFFDATTFPLGLSDLSISAPLEGA